MITELRLGDPVANKYNENIIKDVVHHELVISENLEMTHKVKEVLYLKNPDGSFGPKMLDVINQDQTLTNDLKASEADRYATRIITKTTVGSMVDKATGFPVDPDNPPPGVEVVTDLAYWQGIRLSDLPPGLTTVSDVVYFMLRVNMARLKTRGVV